jgi:hypothetical protein
LPWDFSFRRFDHHRILAPPHDIAHALERDQEWHADQTSGDEACKEDQIPNCRSSAQLPPNTFLSTAIQVTYRCTQMDTGAATVMQQHFTCGAGFCNVSAIIIHHNKNGSRYNLNRSRRAVVA